MTKTNDLDILLPEGDIEINGEKIVIRPFSFAKLPRVISLLSNLGVGMLMLLKSENGLATNEQDIIINDIWLEKFSEIVTEHFSDVVELISIYCNKPQEFFTDEKKGVNVEDALVLILTIIDRNYNFFIRRLCPVLTQISSKKGLNGAE